MGLMMPAHVNPENTNHIAATKKPPTSPKRPTPGRRSSTLAATTQQTTSAARMTTSSQFQGLVPSPKWTNPTPNTAAPPSATDPTTAIDATGPHGGSSTTPAAHPSANRHRPDRSSIRSNSPSIASPHSTRSALSSPPAHRNSRSGGSSGTVCAVGGGCSPLQSSAPTPVSSKTTRTVGRPEPITPTNAETECIRFRSSPGGVWAPIVRSAPHRAPPRTPARSE